MFVVRCGKVGLLAENVSENPRKAAFVPSAAMTGWDSSTAFGAGRARPAHVKLKALDQGEGLPAVWRYRAFGHADQDARRGRVPAAPERGPDPRSFAPSTGTQARARNEAWDRRGRRPARATDRCRGRRPRTRPSGSSKVQACSEGGTVNSPAVTRRLEYFWPIGWKRTILQGLECLSPVAVRRARSRPCLLFL